MVAGNGDSIWPPTTLKVADGLSHPLTDASGTALTLMMILLDDDFFSLALMVRMEGMEHAISGSLQPLAEGVVLTVVVVVTHVAFAFLVNYNVFLGDVFFTSRSTALVFYVVGRLNAAAIVVLCVIKVAVTALVFYVVGRLSAAAIVVLCVIEVAVTAIDFDVNLCIGAAVRLISVAGKG